MWGVGYSNPQNVTVPLTADGLPDFRVAWAMKPHSCNSTFARVPSTPLEQEAYRTSPVARRRCDLARGAGGGPEEWAELRICAVHIRPPPPAEAAFGGGAARSHGALLVHGEQGARDRVGR